MTRIGSLFIISLLISGVVFIQAQTEQAEAQTIPPDSLEEASVEEIADPVEIQMALGDSLEDLGEYQGALEAYMAVLEMDPENYRAAWKTGDQYTDIAKNLPEDAKGEKEEKFDLARQYCEKAIAIDSTGWEGHTYLSIALGRLALFRGGKEKINLSKRVKEEADKGIALNPENDTAYHVVGLWNRNLANLSWVLKTFAKILYGGVPPGSNEEAVACLKKAIEIKPDYINHHLELAKTYEMTGKKELMKEPLNRVLELPATEPDDEEYKAEAQAMLAKLK